LDRQFIRRTDIHLRLGLIYKKLGDYSTSLKHLERALVDPTGVCSLTRFELTYLIGLIYEQQRNCLEAEKIYEKLLKESLTLKFEGFILRQLRWLYFSSDYFQFDKENQIKKSIKILEQSCQCDPTCGITYYYLGRCYAALKKRTEALYTYRNCIDKSDQNADV